jgi:hypothetical protein
MSKTTSEEDSLTGITLKWAAGYINTIEIWQVYSNGKDASQHLTAVKCYIFSPAESPVITKLSQLNEQTLRN